MAPLERRRAFWAMDGAEVLPSELSLRSLRLQVVGLRDDGRDRA